MSETDVEIHHGSCSCGKVTYKTNKPLRPVVACHCSQCRKQTGHHFAATAVDDDGLTIEGIDNMTWYHASDDAKRGFCTTCGSALFWKSFADDFTSILAGSLDGETGIKLKKHIFVDDKGDYYELDDGLPQFTQGSSSPRVE